MATIMIALKSFILNMFASFPSKLLSSFSQFTSGWQRISHPAAGRRWPPWRGEHDRCINSHQGKKLGHIRILHPDAAMARRLANLLFGIGSVNVNVALEDICISGVDPV